jgi:tRNA-splicing ligase RtcB
MRYFAAMACCVNFAFCNRAVIAYFIRKVFEKNYQQRLSLLYDLAHNIAKWEFRGRLGAGPSKNNQILVHRKGATRALPADHPKNPKIYQQTGHPSIVPGSMGTSSYIMVGLEKNQETFYSINHGAGRTMSRTQAKKTIKKEQFEEKMKNIVYNKPFHVISDEAPQAYKDITEVIDTLVEAGLTKKIAKLTPLAVIKGN